tara:strand:- start:706 stop:921 length:216 start_codon:yes stop_codon:yes gene_type:complete
MASHRLRIKRLLLLKLITKKKLEKQTEKSKDQFIRIALAKLKKKYRFYPQRIAMAAKMYRSWIDRLNSKKK